MQQSVKVSHSTASTTRLKGRWTPQEEAYMTFLISSFLEGSIEDCPDGCTLATYLSAKLNCLGMRISKKLAGRSLGSSVYSKYKTSPEVTQKLNHLRNVYLDAIPEPRKRRRKRGPCSSVSSQSNAEVSESNARLSQSGAPFDSSSSASGTKINTMQIASDASSIQNSSILSSSSHPSSDSEHQRKKMKDMYM